VETQSVLHCSCSNTGLSVTLLEDSYAITFNRSAYVWLLVTCGKIKRTAVGECRTATDSLPFVSSALAAQSSISFLLNSSGLSGTCARTLCMLRDTLRFDQTVVFCLFVCLFVVCCLLLVNISPISDYFRLFGFCNAETLCSLLITKLNCGHHLDVLRFITSVVLLRSRASP
jgi:hypothetical protein